jgi:hypothetical protein
MVEAELVYMQTTSWVVSYGDGGGDKNSIFCGCFFIIFFFERCMAWHGIGSERNGLLGL